MALIQATTFQGLAVPAGYWRCARFVFTSKSSCRAYFELYASEEAAHTVNTQPLESTVVDFEYDFNDTALSLNSQAYDIAKTLPEFAGAVDA